MMIGAISDFFCEAESVSFVVADVVFTGAEFRFGCIRKRHRHDRQDENSKCQELLFHSHPLIYMKRIGFQIQTD